MILGAGDMASGWGRMMALLEEGGRCSAAVLESDSGLIL